MIGEERREKIGGIRNTGKETPFMQRHGEKVVKVKSLRRT